jgi:hypothetical protein
MAQSKAKSGFGSRLLRGDGGVGAGTQASKTIGATTHQLKLLARIAGTAGNSKTFGIIVDAGTVPYSQTVTRDSVIINAATTSGTVTTTVAQAIAALYADATFVKYWQANTGTGDGSGILIAGASAVLSGGANGTEIFTDVSEIKNIALTGRNKSVYEVTHMLSPDHYREFRGSLKDGGELAFDMNYINDVQQQALRDDYEDADLVRNFQIIFNTEDDGEVTWQVPCIVNGLDFNFPMEGAIGSQVKVKVTGAIDDVSA